jgi:hypothetical protein
MDSRSLFKRQRAILFEDDVHSGATIGHYCTVVEIHPYSKWKHPDDPDRWWVRIFMPHLNEYREVRAGKLLGMQERDDSPLPPRRFQLEVDCQMISDDHARIEGQYRFGGRWERFIFEKRPQSVATYDLYGQVEGANLKVGRLLYYVPNEHHLDRSYVRQALTEIFSANSRDQRGADG